MVLLWFYVVNGLKEKNDRERRQLAECQAGVSAEEIWPIHWEHRFPRESGPGRL